MALKRGKNGDRYPRNLSVIKVLNEENVPEIHLFFLRVNTRTTTLISNGEKVPAINYPQDEERVALEWAQPKIYEEAILGFSSKSPI
jgi:hypothetical protein